MQQIAMLRNQMTTSGREKNWAMVIACYLGIEREVGACTECKNCQTVKKVMDTIGRKGHQNPKRKRRGNNACKINNNQNQDDIKT